MAYAMKPLTCDPSRIKGMPEKLIVSHYENNYGGAVKRLNLIEEQLAGLDFAKAPGFLLNGLKREGRAAAVQLAPALTWHSSPFGRARESGANCNARRPIC
jgi:hypothetical protein